MCFIGSVCCVVLMKCWCMLCMFWLVLSLMVVCVWIVFRLVLIVFIGWCVVGCWVSLVVLLFMLVGRGCWLVRWLVWVMLLVCLILVMI